MNKLWIGIDGTDSPWGGCTTWTMSNIIDQLVSNDKAIIFHDYPRLIRLNPNIPEKTRGNGALSLHISTHLDVNELGELVKNQIIDDQKKYRLNEEKLPGVVIFSSLPKTNFYSTALIEYLNIENISKQFNPDFIWPHWNQSHIGCIAAVMSDLTADYTFEILSYRDLSKTNMPRIIHKGIVKNLEQRFQELFSSYDYDQDRELIAPSGPDPVFCGIRSNKVENLPQVIELLEIQSSIVSYTIFKTNQGTDSHVINASRGKNKKEEYEVFSGIALIISEPKEIRGGHVFSTSLIQNEFFELSWFEPTKVLRDQSKLLQAGDQIYIDGSIRMKEGKKVINIEFMMIVNAPPRITTKSPKCNCGQRMTSAGAFSGYKCKSCGEKAFRPEKLYHDSPFQSGDLIFAAKSAQRHLTRPLSRIHIRNDKIIENVSYSDFRVKF